MRFIFILFLLPTMVAGQQTLNVIEHTIEGDVIHKREIKYSFGDSLNPEEQNVLKAASSYLGQKVKGGQCTQYLAQVIADVTDISYEGVYSNSQDYLKKIRLSDLRPGDIIKYDNAKLFFFFDTNGNIKYKTITHVRIVKEIKDGIVSTYEQNVGGSPVIIYTADLFCYSGKITFYRIKKIP